MQEVIVLRGGIHYCHDQQGNPKDFYYVNPSEHVRSLQCFVGHPLHVLGHFPDVDLLSIIKEIKANDGNVVACIEEAKVS